jgi:hypothetical protein
MPQPSPTIPIWPMHVATSHMILCALMIFPSVTVKTVIISINGGTDDILQP